MQVNLFRAELAKKGYTQQKLANEMKIAESTLIRKMKNDSFTMEEANKIIDILDIEKPEDIFFAKRDT